MTVTPSTDATTDRPVTILIVEDNRPLREGLALNLRPRGYRVLMAADGDEGMRMAFDARPDLIVLDLMLPGGNGMTILESLRERGERVPVLILSARGTTPDKVAGLTLGADDYMTKPFDLPELLARVEAMLRRRRTDQADQPPLQVGNIRIDRTARHVTANGKEVPLSAREFDLLCLLAESPGRAFTRESILDRVWGWDYEGTPRTVDNFVAALRKKLHFGRRLRPCIRTVPRVGYRLEA